MYSVAIDRKWQKIWDEQNLAGFNPDDNKEKLYVLEMFSYPSGANLHIGHWYNYALADSWARLKKMQGKAIFQPMGFDAFGLPAENYAIKTGIHPQDSTLKNIETMTEQLKQLGGLFNWEHTLATCDETYYRWTQWLFLLLYKNGLAYRKNAPVNWCPSCNTVLANEQVLEDGTCERCEALVTKKNLTQWFFGITKYADELIDKLDTLDWPEKTKKIQRNWIGRSEGTHIVFDVMKEGQPVPDDDGRPLRLTVFTTRADTVYGVTYLVIAPESPLLDKLTTAEQKEDIRRYVEKTRLASDIDRMATTREKTGVFTGSYVIHPLTGEKVPLWTSDYVIASYGTGVVMAVPAHDTRDFEFATKFGLPIERVIINPADPEEELPTVEYGILENSGPYDGLSSEDAIEKITAALTKHGNGAGVTNYRLRDWLVSRQRYWGAPIPIVYCDRCGTVPVPEKDLPVKLPYDVEFTPDGSSPLAKSDKFMHTSCPECGGPALRDPDTLDTFVCSSFYQFRYVDNLNENEAFNRDKVNAMCPVDMYIGGAEHASMHLLYARFITKVLRDTGHLDFDEPFQALIHQGTILGRDGQKMSKSLGNTVSPDEYVEKYGGDVFRLHLAFSFAFTEGGAWSDDGVLAVNRFINRVETFVNKVVDATIIEGAEDRELTYRKHFSIRGVSQDAEHFQFNTSIARIMELLNALQKSSDQGANVTKQIRSVTETMILLLAPFAPHFAEEMWQRLGHDQSVFLQKWPVWDDTRLIRDQVEIAVQINGQIKTRINVDSEASAEDIEAQIRQDERFLGWLDKKEAVKWIYVKGRLMNIVAR